MKDLLLLLLITPLLFLSCKKDDVQNSPSLIEGNDCTGKTFYFQMIHSELGQVNTSQTNSHSVIVVAAPEESNPQNLLIFLSFANVVDMYSISMVIEQGNQLGTYSFGVNFGEMNFSYGFHLDSVIDFTITIDKLEGLTECTEYTGLCYKKVNGHFSGVFNNTDGEGTSVVSGNFCINR